MKFETELNNFGSMAALSLTLIQFSHVSHTTALQSLYTTVYAYISNLCAVELSKLLSF
jgi:hypothetical protein